MSMDFEGQKLVVIDEASGMTRQPAADVIVRVGSAIVTGRARRKLDNAVAGCDWASSTTPLNSVRGVRLGHGTRVRTRVGPQLVCAITAVQGCNPSPCAACRERRKTCSTDMRTVEAQKFVYGREGLLPAGEVWVSCQYWTRRVRAVRGLRGGQGSGSSTG